MRRPAASTLVVLCLLAALLAVDLAIWRHAAHAEEQSRAGRDALAESVERVPRLLGYSWQTLGSDLGRANAMTTGRFHDEYAKVLHEVVEPAATKDRIRTSVSVQQAGLVRGESDRVVVLLFLTQTTLRGTAATPVVTGSRVEVTLRPVGRHWLISGLKPV